MTDELAPLYHYMLHRIQTREECALSGVDPKEQSWNEMLLLGCLENPDLHRAAMRTIKDSGRIHLYHYARSIKVKLNWREIERQCKAETKHFLEVDSWDYWTKYDHEGRTS